MSNTKLNRFWRSLEIFLSQATVTDEWRMCLGSEFEAAIRFLRATNQLATYYPRSHPFDPLRVRSPWRVISHGPDHHVGICPDGGLKIQLTTEQLIIYELNQALLARQLAEALGLAWEAAQVDGVPRTYRIGTLTPTAGFRFPVYLTIPQTTSEFRRAVDGLSALQADPFLLMAPTRSRCEPAAEAVLERNGGDFIPLVEALTLDETGTLQLNKDGRLLLTRFLEQHVPSAKREPQMEFFPTPPDATWSNVCIRFLDGERLSVRVGGVSKVVNYTAMGMASAKDGAPTKQWRLLRDFAYEHGFLDWDSRYADRKNQKQKELLSALLKRFFRIEGEPFRLEGNGWQTLFAIEPD